MRKRFALCLAMILLLSACTLTSEQTHDGEQAVFFYENRNADQLTEVVPIGSENRYFGDYSISDFLDLYLRGPEDERLQSPFPAGTQVLDIHSGNGELTLTMSGEYFTLYGVNLSVANCCLASTVCSYVNLASVTIMDETETIRMEVRPDDYLLQRDNTLELGESFTLYFASQDYRYLIAETRDATLSENESEIAYVMRQLFDGPVGRQLHGIIPDGTELLSVSSQDGVCTLDFSGAFYENRLDDTYGAYMTIFGIVNTLTNLPDVQSVEFLLEGAPMGQYGVFSLEEPLTRNADAIGPVRTASSEIDVNVYVLSNDGGAQFAVPYRIRQTISEPLAEAVITQVLSYEAFSGFYNPVPFGTELLSISMSGNVCYVDVSDRFIPLEDTEEAEQAAVWALVMPLVDLDNISSVMLTINGESGGLSFVDISAPITRRMVEGFNA